MTKQTVALSELESIGQGHACTYPELAAAVRQLETDQVLTIVKAQGMNGKQPPLAYQYRIHKNKLNHDLHKELQRAKLMLHPLIGIDAYYRLPSTVWQQDLPYIERIDRYLKQHSLPLTAVPAPERSVALVGDEKWISEQGGEEVLVRLGLWTAMRIIPVADPIMFAINPQQLGQPAQRHLIVENKTTYQGLLAVLPDMPFTTLIFGGGKKIIRSIELFPQQLPLPSVEQRFYYFGDLDHEGLNIWYALRERAQALLQAEVRPALPFYQAYLAKSYLFGKLTHRKDEQAQQAFGAYFSAADQLQLRACLAAGGYYPQEILSAKELEQQWRSGPWI